MEGNDCQSAAGSQHRKRRFQPVFQMFKLPVHRNADRLEGFFAGIFHPAHLLRYAAFDDFRQFQCGVDRLFLSCPHNIPGDAPGEGLFPIGIQDPGKLLFRNRIHQFFRRHAGLAHTHIQGCIVVIGKPTGILVQLVGRNAQIQQHAVHRDNAHLRQHRLHFIIIVVYHRCRIRCEPLRCHGNCVGIPVKANEPAAVRQTFCNFRGVSGAADGAVHINAVRANCQPIQHLVQQHGNVYKFHT